jgi:hypothetical protein
MRHQHIKGLVILAAVLGTSLGARAVTTPLQNAPTTQERVAALKQSLAESQKAIRQYEWIETTIVSLKGEEKARTQKRCFYGADGKLQKLDVSGAAPQQQAPSSGGRRGGGRLKTKVVENKKEDMKEYMEQAAGLVHQYVPPKPEDIQRAKDAGKVKASTAGPGRARLEFTDYLKPGDRLAVDVDAAANRLLGLTVASYLDKPEDVVTLDVQLAALANGTTYTAQTTLDAAAKKIRVVIQNSGHRPLAP